MKPTRRLFWFLSSTVLLCALLGGVYGQRVEATTDPGESDVQSSLNAFTKVFDVVQKNYADAVDPDTAVYGPQNSNEGAIPGMLRTLDPHSNFFDPHAFAQLREDQEGRYYGVGMTIQQRPGKLGTLQTIVLLPLPGSPAFRAGLRPGDIIVKVDSKSTEGLNSSKVAELLKGPKGTVVRVTVSREGSEQPLDFVITRDEISRKSVDDAFTIQPGIAYVHIDKFNETTNDELTATLKKFNEKNLKGLILDLRGNPGGLLQEAVDVSDHFLEKHQLIVYHYGRHSKEKRYYATKGDSGNEYPIVVLINRSTASAAEIVTGALQDHDRALVMGEPSFGKGLVQTVYPLSEHTGLALTTAHYYTPSGRLIQRTYTNVSLYDYYFRSEDAPTPHDDVKVTDGGREVYGGGGITPDVRVTDPALKPFEEKLVGHDVFFNFGKYYLANHKTIPLDFVPDDSTIAEFKGFLMKQDIPATSKEISDNLDFIKNHIRIQLVATIFGEDEAKRISVENDYVVKKALGSFSQAQELVARAHKYVADKDTRREQ
jgi:carboxyl-terminal processing protease